MSRSKLFTEAKVGRQDFIMRFPCGCFIINRAETNYREYNRMVCAKHRKHNIIETELEQRSINLDVLAAALNPGLIIIDSGTRH